MHGFGHAADGRSKILAADTWEINLRVMRNCMEYGYSISLQAIEIPPMCQWNINRSGPSD
jgi:hypothetical protein